MIGRLLVLGLLLAIVLAVVEARRRPRTGRGKAASAVVYSLVGCATCEAQSRVLDLLQPSLRARVRLFDLAASPDEADRLGIRSVPTTMFFDSAGDAIAVRRGLVDAPEFEHVFGLPADSHGADVSQPAFDITRYF